MCEFKAVRKTDKMQYLLNFGVGWGLIPENDSVALVDTCGNSLN